MKIKFAPTGQEIDANPDKTLLQLCTENNIEIRSICKGVPSCAECRVRIVSGENNLIPPNRAELSLIGSSYYLDGRRLSCQVRCFGEITVDLTEQIEKADSPNKKVRGFRPQDRSVETTAVQGTLVLEEKPAAQPQGQSQSQEARDSQEPRPPREDRGPRQDRQQRQDRGPRGDRGGRDDRNRDDRSSGGRDQRPQQQGAKQNQNRPQNQGGGRGGGGGGGQNQGGQQGQGNQQKNRNQNQDRKR